MSFQKARREHPRLHRLGALRRAGPRWLLRGSAVAMICAGGLWWWMDRTPSISDLPPAIGEAPEAGAEGSGGEPDVGTAKEGALAVAMEAALAGVRQGFTVREDFWGGEMNAGEQKTVAQQLFKGNDYWLWVGSDTPGAEVTVHAYDAAGQSVDVEESGNGDARPQLA